MHVAVYQGRTRYGNTFECSCGKLISGEWDEATLNEIAHEHQRSPDLSFIQCAKNVVTGDSSNWSSHDKGFPWGSV